LSPRTFESIVSLHFLKHEMGTDLWQICQWICTDTRNDHFCSW